MIRSVLHKVLPVLEHPHMARDPFFAFDEKVTDLLVGNKAAIASIEALMEHGLVHLPYPQMTVQFKRGSGEITWVLWMQELDGTFNCELRYHATTHDVADVACRAKVTPDYDGNHSAGVFKATINLNAVRSAGKSEADKQQMAEDLAPLLCCGVTMAVLMTHIAGLEREEHVPPEKLNAARERKGKEPIRRYHYVHVGHVYGSDGTKHDYNKTGRRMPIHMRAGHNRRQHFGAGREQTKLIWIPPVLVNYDGKTEPVVEKRVVL